MEQIGLQAILDDAQFQKGANNYTAQLTRMINSTQGGASEMLIISQATSAFGDSLSVNGEKARRYGEELNKIKADLASGKISMEQARDAVARLNAELANATAAERQAISIRMMRQEAAQAALNVVGLGDRVANYKQMLAAATPENIRFAQTFDQIQREFVEGSISAEQARQAVDQLEQEMKQAGQAAGGAGQQTGNFFTEMNSQLQLIKQGLQMFSQVFTETFEFGKAGALVMQTGDSFETLGNQAGDASLLLNQLKQAAGGTISELQLMTSANMALTGVSGDVQKALSDAMPAMLEMARAATKAAPEIGSVDYVFQSLIRGVRRGSPMLIDNANIMVKAGTANEDYAKSVGKTVEELTQEEKMMATLNAVLAQHDMLITQAGGSLDSQEDRYSRMEAAVDNAGNAFKERFAPFVTQAADAIYYLLEGQNLITAGIQEQMAQIDITKTSFEGYAAEVDRLAEATGRTTISQAGWNVMLQQGVTLEEMQRNYIVRMTEAEYAQEQQTISLTRAYEAAGVGINQWSYYSATAIEYGHALEMTYANQARQAEEARVAAYEYEQRLRILNNQQQELMEKARAAEPAIADLLDTLNQDIGSPLTNFIQDLRFTIASGAADFKGALQDIQAALSENKITEAQALEFSGALMAAFENAKIAAGEIDFDTAAEELASALGIPLPDAEALLTKFTDLDTVTAALNKQIQMNIQAENLDKSLEDAGNLDMALTALDELNAKPTVTVEGAAQAATDLQHMNEAAMAVEDTLPGMVEATGSMPEGAENIGAMNSGLAETAAKADAAASALRRLQTVIDGMDFSNVDPVVAHSPPPLGAGLDYVNAVMPETLANFAALQNTINGFGDSFTSYVLNPLDGLPDKAGKITLFLDTVMAALANADEAMSNLDIAGELLDIAGTFGGLGNAAANILKEHTIEPLSDMVESLDETMAEMLEGFGETLGMKDLNFEQLQTFVRTFGGGWMSPDQLRQYQLLVEMNEQRAAAAAEVAAAEERVLKLQEQQQNLQFLQQQMKLLELIQEYGLNPDEILGGLELGLDADINAVVDAMTAAMQQIIAAAEDELDIHSPSGVAQGWMENVMTTMEDTITRLSNRPGAAMQNSLSGLFAPRPSPVSYVTQRTGPTLNMPVNTTITNREEGIMFETRVRRVVETVLQGY